MQAALLTKLDSPLTLAHVSPCDLTYGQVKVRMLASGICGAQLAEIRGDKGNAGHLPHLLGHEGVGIVAEVGPAVTRVKVGEKCVCHWRKGEGIESDFPRYNYEGKEITSGKVITFAEEAIISENRLTPVPASTPDELCALLGCGLSTALGTIENEAALKFGENILIVGVGGLGINLILAAKIRGAGHIVACDSRDKGQLALSMGATTFFRPTANIGKLIAPGGKQPQFDVIVDTAGMADSMEATLPFLASGGRFIMVGQPRPNVDVVMQKANHMFAGDGKTIKATQGGAFNPSRDIPRYIDLWESGRLKLDGLITHRLRLEDVNDGLELVRSGQAGRVLLEMN